ncbi:MULTISPECIES: hypothetical protein [unclassified Erwinia]|nr:MULTISPECIES: hypothetical protein [unclassified Erwinia]
MECLQAKVIKEIKLLLATGDSLPALKMDAVMTVLYLPVEIMAD